MTITIFDVLQNANYNIQNNGIFGIEIAKEQLRNAVEQLEDGKSLDDEFEGDDEQWQLSTELSTNIS